MWLLDCLYEIVLMRDRVVQFLVLWAVSSMSMRKMFGRCGCVSVVLSFVGIFFSGTDWTDSNTMPNIASPYFVAHAIVPHSTSQLFSDRKFLRNRSPAHQDLRMSYQPPRNRAGCTSLQSTHTIFSTPSLMQKCSRFRPPIRHRRFNPLRSANLPIAHRWRK